MLFDERNNMPEACVRIKESGEGIANYRFQSLTMQIHIRI